MMGLSACGGDDSDADAGGSDATAGSSDSQQDRALVRLTECLRDQGIDVPDNFGQAGGGPPPDVDQAQMREALEGPCQELQADAFGDFSGDEQTEFQDRLTKFTACMRENGIDIPDFEIGSGPPPQIDQDDPAVQKAAKACQDVLPSDALPQAG